MNKKQHYMNQTGLYEARQSLLTRWLPIKWDPEIGPPAPVGAVWGLMDQTFEHIMELEGVPVQEQTSYPF